jgi:hypothetical protein
MAKPFSPGSVPEAFGLTALIRWINATWARFEQQQGRGPKYCSSRTTTAATTGIEGDEYIRVNTSGGAVTVTLPDPLTMLGRTVTIKLVTGTNPVTVSGSIEDGSSWAWSTPKASFEFRATMTSATAAQWEIV